MAKEQKGSKFLNDLKKDLGSASIGFENELKVKNWYSTGSMMLDMQMNGGYLTRGGIAESKLTVMSGPESCGKTFFVIQSIINFLKVNTENAYVAFFDSENNVSGDTFLNAGLPEEDLERILIINVMTYEEFRTKALQTYKASIANNNKLMLVLDSLGGLLSLKELTEAEAEPSKEGLAEVKAGVGRPQSIIKQMIKMLEFYAPKVQSPIIIVSHVYANIGSLFGGNTLAGGSGIRYFNSNCVEFSRAQNKEGDSSIHDINGIIVTSKLIKSRFAREMTKVKSYINFNTGVQKYYGLVSLLELSGLIFKTGNRYQIEKDLEGNWTGKKYWTKELNDNIELILPFIPKLENWTIRNFGLGKMSLITDNEELKEIISTSTNNDGKILDYETLINEENEDNIGE